MLWGCMISPPGMFSVGNFGFIDIKKVIIVWFLLVVIIKLLEYYYPINGKSKTKEVFI